MIAPFPPPNATRAEIEAWERTKPKTRAVKPKLSEMVCVCADPRSGHGNAGAAGAATPCLREGCGCVRFRPRKTCTSCGQQDGHRRGDRACPNYDTPARWQAHGKLWGEP